tara:strand:- start:50 stop:388 length:339 start_codon:yes stop_codon:yes gene_type:complete
MINHYEDTKCVNCGWSPNPDVIHELFEIQYSNGHYRTFDVEILQHRRQLGHFLKECPGSLRSPKYDEKGHSCAVCGLKVVRNSYGQNRRHRPSKKFANQIIAALQPILEEAQ